MTAATLFPDTAEHRTIAERFDAFHAANPQVYAMFVRLAQDAWAAGCRRYSADALLHVLRWKIRVETGGDDGFALNNSFTSRYARKMIEDYPKFSEFFELRAIRSE